MTALAFDAKRRLFRCTSPTMSENGCIPPHDCLLLHSDGAYGNGIRGLLASGSPLLFTSIPSTANVSAEVPDLHPHRQLSD